MKASCLCGKVQIKIGDLTGPFELCHCNRCKKHTGSAFNPVLDSTVEGYEIISGRKMLFFLKPRWLKLSRTIRFGFAKHVAHRCRIRSLSAILLRFRLE